jgi:predicted RNA-binding protein with EMAP domain
MTNQQQAKELLYAYMDVEKDLSQPKILIHTLKELINLLQYDNADWQESDEHMVIDVKDFLKLIEELENI